MGKGNDIIPCIFLILLIDALKFTSLSFLYPPPPFHKNSPCPPSLEKQILHAAWCATALSCYLGTLSELLGNHRFANCQRDWISYEPKNMPPNGGVLDLKGKQNHLQYCLKIVVISNRNINKTNKSPTRIGMVLIPPGWFWASKSHIDLDTVPKQNCFWWMLGQVFHMKP